MLEQALKVIEAARLMKLVRKKGRTISDLPPLELARAIDGLRQAIEQFDRETGTESGSPTPAPKPEWATPPVPEDELPVPKLNLTPEYVDPEAEIELELRASPEREPEPCKPTPEMPAPVPASAVASMAMSPRVRGTNRNLDLGDDGAFFDGDESAADLLLAIDSINDKLAFAVTKVGWSPRLRALAEAARIAQNNMYIEVDNAHGWVRVPAHNWGTLTVAIAEAALDQDLSIALPKFEPKPRGPELDPEYSFAPRPRFPSR